MAHWNLVHTLRETGKHRVGWRVRIYSYRAKLDRHLQHYIANGPVTLAHPEEILINGVGGYYELYVDEEKTSGQQATITSELATGRILHHGNDVVRTGSKDSYDVLLRVKEIEV